METGKENSTQSAAPRVRLGVALSGGGARGFAHAGALAALEEGGHRPDVIAGVSAGSIVAALYAAGSLPLNFQSCSPAAVSPISSGSGPRAAVCSAWFRS